MNFIKILGTMSLSCAVLASIGCGGGSSTPPSYGSSNAASNYFAIQTLTAASGTREAWKNVTISGYADTTSLASVCSPASDPNCIAEVGGPYLYANTQNAISAFTTDNNGRANFFTNAQPAIWKFDAKGPSQSGCSSVNASNQTYQGEPTGSIVALTCGSNTASMMASPSSCITKIDQYGGFISSTCPATVTLSFPVTVSTPVALPLNTSLTAANYSTTGTNLAQASVTASTANSINVPVPTTTGLTYLAVQDASTGAILGVSQFTYSTKVIKCSPTNGNC